MNIKLKMSSGESGFYNNMLVGTLPSDMLPYEQKFSCQLVDNTGANYCNMEFDGNNGKMYIRNFTAAANVYILYGEVSYFYGTITSGSVQPGGQ